MKKIRTEYSYFTMFSIKTRWPFGWSHLVGKGGIIHTAVAGAHLRPASVVLPVGHSSESTIQWPVVSPPLLHEMQKKAKTTTSLLVGKTDKANASYRSSHSSQLSPQPRLLQLERTTTLTNLGCGALSLGTALLTSMVLPSITCSSLRAASAAI